MTCPVCKKKVDAVRTAIKNGQYVSDRCDKCHALFNSNAVFARKSERDWQRRHFARDLIQPSDPEFAKEFPKQAREKGWSDEQMRKYG